MSDKTFDELGLAEPILRAVTEAGYKLPTPIQAQTIPALLEGEDILGVAQTGTGKTASFVLPILHHLRTNPIRLTPRGARAVILAPTRELAVQIADSLDIYGRFIRFRSCMIFGGVGQVPQVRRMSRGVDVIVATPGRLLDLIQQGHVRLDTVEFLVLDEADRMLDMGFVHDVRKIISKMPTERQSLLFSATMPKDIEELAGEMLRDPRRVDIAPKQIAVERIEQRVFHIEKDDKPALLAELLADSALSRVIVFTRTKHGADRVARQLERKGIATEALHGNKTQGARQKALGRFRSGHARVLVATDIAARGIDVAEISHVINYELPNVAESYVHRIGRTGRAGHDGIAMSFCEPTERPYLRDIERLTKQTIEISQAATVNNLPPPGPRSGPAPKRSAKGGKPFRNNRPPRSNGEQRPQEGRKPGGGGARDGNAPRRRQRPGGDRHAA